MDINQIGNKSIWEIKLERINGPIAGTEVHRIVYESHFPFHLYISSGFGLLDLSDTREVLNNYLSKQNLI